MIVDEWKNLLVPKGSLYSSYSCCPQSDRAGVVEDDDDDDDEVDAADADDAIQLCPKSTPS